MNLGIVLELGDMESFVSSDTVCSTHVAEKGVNAHVPSDIYQSPLTSGDMEFCVLTDTVCSTHAAENNVTQVCVQTK